MVDFSTDHPPVTTDQRMKALRGLSRIERELDYLDESISERELPPTQVDGERYKAEVPDTLDLTDNARHAINAYTRMVDPAMDYRFCGNANFVRKPPVVILGGGHETCETCETADMMLLGLKLTLAGAGEYWEDVDRCLRNQFVENQITRADWPDCLLYKENWPGAPSIEAADALLREAQKMGR